MTRSAFRIAVLLLAFLPHGFATSVATAQQQAQQQVEDGEDGGQAEDGEDGDSAAPNDALSMPQTFSGEAPYMPDLIRLSEIAGATQYLRRLCGEANDSWQKAVAAIIATTDANEAVRRQITAAYNRGYRNYANYHRRCTEASTAAAERYRVEGRILSRSILDRYSQ